MLLLEVTGIVASMLRDQFGNLGKQELIRTLKVKLFEALVSQDFYFFEKSDLWDQRQVIGNCGHVVKTLLDYPVQCVEAFGRAAASFLILWRKNRRLSLFVFLLMPLKIAVSNRLRSWHDHLETVYVAPDIRGKVREVWRALTRPSAFMTIRMFGREPEEAQNFSSFLLIMDRDENQRSMLYSVFSPLEPFLENLIQMLVLWYGGRLIIRGAAREAAGRESAPPTFAIDGVGVSTEREESGQLGLEQISKSDPSGKEKLLVSCEHRVRQSLFAKRGTLSRFLQGVLNLPEYLESGLTRASRHRRVFQEPSKSVASIEAPPRTAEDPTPTTENNDAAGDFFTSGGEGDEQEGATESDDLFPDVEQLGFGDLSAFLIMANNAFDSARFLRTRAEGLGDEILDPAEKIMTLLQLQPKIGLFTRCSPWSDEAVAPSLREKCELRAVDDAASCLPVPREEENEADTLTLRRAGEALESRTALATLMFGDETAKTDTQMAMLREVIPPPVARLHTLAFEHVSFRYPSRPSVAVLNDVSFHIRAGDHLGILGQTGSGKSSIFLLMLRVYDVDSGRILLNGRDLRDYEPLWLRRKFFSIVTQDIVLLERSIKDNIMYGARPGQLTGKDAEDDYFPSEEGSADYEKHLSDVMDIAQCRETFFDQEKFPQGWYTAVGEYGCKLSGGQKQRIGLARALWKGSEVLLLDEATSALDETTQSAVQQNLERLRSQNAQTIITIAHRVSNFRFSNRLLVLRDGKVMEEGSPQDLLQKDEGTYAQYVNACLTATDRNTLTRPG
ncbi:unnamed protein product [Amoebophrya sp. A25]|nr:unnamed protein product [Amoebophrya sp. A25]|eukprot:GSA25T00025272001.1